jgi:thiol-disulfide isomerase/thioredoxin
MVVENIDTVENFFTLLKEENPGAIIIKFGANWCKPCQTIKPLIKEKFNDMNHNVLCIDIDIDTTKAVYNFLKSRRFIRGIPGVLCYFKKNDEDVSDFDCYIPDIMITGADINGLNKLFETVKNRC